MASRQGPRPLDPQESDWQRTGLKQGLVGCVWTNSESLQRDVLDVSLKNPSGESGGSCCPNVSRGKKHRRRLTESKLEVRGLLPQALRQRRQRLASERGGIGVHFVSLLFQSRVLPNCPTISRPLKSTLSCETVPSQFTPPLCPSKS